MKVINIEDAILINKIKKWWYTKNIKEFINSLTKEENEIVNLLYSGITENSYKENYVCLNVYTNSPLCTSFPVFIHNKTGLIDIVSLRFLKSFGVKIKLEMYIDELLEIIKKTDLDYHEIDISVRKYNLNTKKRKNILLYCDNLCNANNQLSEMLNRNLNNYRIKEKILKKQLKN